MVQLYLQWKGYYEKMKTACKTLKWSLGITILSLILSISFFIFSLYYDVSLNKFLLNLFIGIFSSSIVTLLLSIPNYIVARKQLLEKYWEETRRLIASIYNIEYLDIEFNKDDFIGYINEITSNLWKKEYNNHAKSKIKINDEYKNKLLEYLAIKHCDLKEKLSKNSFEIYLNHELEKETSKIFKHMDKILYQYKKCDEENTINLNFMLGDTEFISGKKFYNEIILNLYKPIYNLLYYIRKEIFHFNLYLNNEGNKAVVLGKILDLQNNIFTIEENEESITVFNSFNDKMHSNLESFRAKIYNIKPTQNEIHPVLYIVRKKYNNINKRF